MNRIKTGLLGLIVLCQTFCFSVTCQVTEKNETKEIDASNFKTGDEYTGVTITEEKYGNEKVLSATLKINPDKIINRPTKMVLGYNHNWFQMQPIAVNPNTTEINPEYVKIMKGTPLPLNRMSGTGSQSFKWKETLDPADQRKEQIGVFDYQTFHPNMGIIEWIVSCKMIDPEARFGFVFNLNLGDKSAEDAADVVEFLTGDGKTNPRGGINWAQKRIELGLPDPVPVDIWELGNETDWNRNMRWEKEKYLEVCKQVIPLVKEVNPNISLAAHCTGAPWNTARYKDLDEWRSWHRLWLKEIGNEIDYIVFHSYYEGVPARQVLGTYLKMIEEDVLTITGSDRIKAYLSEHAMWPNRDIAAPGEKRGKLSMDHSHSMEGIVKTMDYYTRAYNNPFIAAAAYHSFRGGPWKLIDITPEGNFYKTGIADMFELLNEAHSDEVLETSILGKYCDPDQKEPTANFLSCAFKDGDEIRVVVVNKSSVTARNLKIKMEGNYKIVKERIVTAENYGDFNTPTEKKIQTINRLLKKPQDIKSVSILPKAVYLFTLKRIY